MKAVALGVAGVAANKHSLTAVCAGPGIATSRLDSGGFDPRPEWIEQEGDDERGRQCRKRKRGGKDQEFGPPEHLNLPEYAIKLTG